MRERRDYEKRAIKRVILRAALVFSALLIIVSIGLLNYYLPLQTLVRAYELPTRGEGEMRLHFLDVGQGDCTILEFPDGSIYLVDGGDGSSAHNNRVLRYLKGLGASDITVIATHDDSDHVGGLTTVLETFSADRIYLAGDESAYHVLNGAWGKNADMVHRYTAFSGGDAYMVCLSPYTEETAEGNEASAVLYLSYAGVNALLTSDITSEREGLLCREYALFEGLFDSGEYAVRLEDTNILKVSHHGSGSGSSAEWLKLLGAETAIISCGRGNNYGHPSTDTISRLTESGSEIFRTDELGDIMITISPSGTYKIDTGYIK